MEDKYYYSDGSVSRDWIPSKILHRIDGPAIEWDNGHKEWHFNHKLHCENGPAVEYVDGSKAWWIHGVRHRLDGPAIEYGNGSFDWYIDGYELSEKEFEAHPLRQKYLFEQELERILNG